MLKYSFERKQGVPLYEELYKALKADILKGRLRAGERLPSKRAMAEDNDISVTTVLNAYQQLLTEGYITSREKTGYFVSDIKKIDPIPETSRPFVGKYYKEDEWFADFQSNNFLYNHFPFAMWKKVIREILSENDLELVRRGNPFGLEELRTQIAEFLYRSRGIIRDSEENAALLFGAARRPPRIGTCKTNQNNNVQDHLHLITSISYFTLTKPAPLQFGHGFRSIV